VYIRYIHVGDSIEIQRHSSIKKYKFSLNRSNWLLMLATKNSWEIKRGFASYWIFAPKS